MKIRCPDDKDTILQTIMNLSEDEHWSINIRKIKKRNFRIKTRSLSVADTFWAFTEKHSDGDCWLSIGPKRKNHGIVYGYFRKKTENKLRQYSAKTLSLQINGKYIPRHPVITSLCGNSLCVNPEHMSVYGSS